MPRPVLKALGAITALASAATVSRAQLLYQENFNDGAATGRWTARNGADNGVADSLVNLNFDYSSAAIPAAPSGTGTRGVKLDANIVDVGSMQAAAVNIFPNGQNFIGDFVLRADWWAQVGANGSTTEDSLFGLNATGTRANWFSSNGPGTDGLFFSVTEDGGTGGRNDYIAYRGSTAGDPTVSPLWDNLDVLPQTVFPPEGGGDPGGTPKNRWVAMEISSVGNRITWRLNGVAIAAYDNPSGFVSGNIFLGHQDLFDSVGTQTFSIFDNIRVMRAARWNVDFDGAWDTNSNWANGQAPGGVDAIAHFGNVITAPRGIVIGGPKLLGDLSLDSGFSYLLSGSQTITFQRSTGSSFLNVGSGRHTITAPVSFANNLVVDVQDPFGQSNGIILTSGLRQQGATPRTLTKTGLGELVTSQVLTAKIDLVEGTLKLDPASSGTGSLVNELKIKAPAPFFIAAATLDLRRSGIIVDYSTNSPYMSMRNMIVTAAYAGWNAVGITSSLAAVTPGTAVGYAEGSALGGRSEIFGFSFDSTSVIARYTLQGDANLDGVVNLSDFALLAANFNSRNDWVNGDFNFDGSNNIGDFSLLAANFNRVLMDAAPRGSVPEPAAAIAAALPLLLRRRRISPGQAISSS